MLEKLYRRTQDSCIYEVICQAEYLGSSPRWILWNENLGERRIATEAELTRQIRWDLVGKPEEFERQGSTAREVPSALLH